MASSIERLRPGLTRALATLERAPGDRAHDASMFPRALTDALRGEEPLVLRVGHSLGAAANEHGPSPREPLWMRLEPQGAAVRIVSLLGGEARGVAALRIVLRAEEEWCCDAPKCQRTRVRFEVAVVTDADDALGPLTVHEGTSRPDAQRIASALASRLGVPLEGDPIEPDPALESDVEAAPSEEEPALTAEELAHWSLRNEAGRWVVRDRATLGPRQALHREVLLLGALVAAALGSGVGASLAWHAGDRERASIYGICGVVCAVASFAVSQIALHSARYRAEGAPVLFAHRNRFVASPWVARDGAVMLVPEGRYGAGLPIEGIERIVCVGAGGEHRLLCESDHGAIELGVFASERTAKAWRRVVERLLDMSRHVPSVVVALALCGALFACGGQAAVGPSVAPAGSAASSAVSAAASSGAGARVTGSAIAAASPTSSASTPSSVPSSQVASVSSPSRESAPARSVDVALPTIDDDLPAALAEGKRRGVPVLVDVWAAWCHTCLSMRAFVLPNPAIAGLSNELVFATIDSENARNADVLERYRVGVWPTFFVVDSKDGAVLGLWEGSASVDELRAFLRGTLDASRAAKEPALAALLKGNREQAAGRCSTAVQHQQRALSLGGPAWSRRSEAVKSLIFCQRRLRQWKACVNTGIAEAPGVMGASIPADIAGTLLDCADEVSDAALRERARDVATARLRALVESPPEGSSTDDRADALSLLADALTARGQRAEARGLLDRQLALLEAAASAAPSPEVAATFDYARMNAYVASGRADEAVSLLERRCAEMPDAYEPRARLAQALRSLGRHEEALRAVEEALARIRGPRRTRYLTMQADLLATLGRSEREREVVRELVATYEALPAGAREHPSNVSGLKAARARLGRTR